MSHDDPFSDSTTVARPAAAFTASRKTYPFVLQAVEGLDRGLEFVVDDSRPSRVFVGKSHACEIRLRDPAVSRRHVALEVRDARLRVVDLGSTNGTFVDGVAIGEAFVSGGETIRVGGTAIAVSRGQPVSMALSDENSFGTTIASSPAMRRLYPLCHRLAATDVPVIIEGETGTGKEQLAESLHRAGPRSAGPFQVFDCTAVAPSLIESELFGHERGAFTGATSSYRGIFERAHGGTLLVDEIGDLPLALQPKLLRVIERGAVSRLGSQERVKVDVRIMSATRRNLDQLVQLGQFRDDLFHRLAVTRIELPPLRDREGDVSVLARHFWREFGGNVDRIPSDLLQRWEGYGWPGNVRELRNAVARRLALGDVEGGDEPTTQRPGALSRAATPVVMPNGDPIAAILAQDLSLADARQLVTDELERRYLEKVLSAHDGNITRAAAAAGIARRHFHRLRAKFSRDVTDE